MATIAKDDDALVQICLPSSSLSLKEKHRGVVTVIAPVLACCLVGAAAASLDQAAHIVILSSIFAAIVALLLSIVSQLDTGRVSIGELAAAPALSLAPAPTQGTVRSLGTTVVSWSGEPVLAASLCARSPHGQLFVRSARSAEFTVELATGEQVHIATNIHLEGTGRPIEYDQERSLFGNFTQLLPHSNTVEEIVLREGARVEVWGQLRQEQVAAGYRETKRSVLRATDAHPVVVRIL